MNNSALRKDPEFSRVTRHRLSRMKVNLHNTLVTWAWDARGYTIGGSPTASIPKGQHQSSGKEKESCCLLVPSSTKREIRQFHLVVLQRQKRNVRKSVMHVQSFCFACPNLLLFCFKTMCHKTIIRFGFCDIRNNQGLGSFISFGLLARLITLSFTSTLIIPDITKTTSNIYLLSTSSSSCPWSSLSAIIIIHNIIGFLNHPLF